MNVVAISFYFRKKWDGLCIDRWKGEDLRKEQPCVHFISEAIEMMYLFHFTPQISVVHVRIYTGSNML